MCASCHEGGADRAPTREALRAMTRGARAGRARKRTDDLGDQPPHRGRSAAPSRNSSPGKGWERWRPNPAAGDVPGGAGASAGSPRRCGADGARASPIRISRTQPGFIAAEVPRLKVKWAFALPGEIQSLRPSHHQWRPAISGKRQRHGVFAGREVGLHSLVFSGRFLGALGHKSGHAHD